MKDETDQYFRYPLPKKFPPPEWEFEPLSWSKEGVEKALKVNPKIETVGGQN